MLAKDFFHNAVRLALEKDGWLITDDPLSFTVDSLEFTIDLGAEKEGQKIAVNIKSFVGKSTISEFHRALGQTLNYRYILKKAESERLLYSSFGVNEVYLFWRVVLKLEVQSVTVPHQPRNCCIVKIDG